MHLGALHVNDDDEGCRFHIPYSPLPSSRTNEGTNEQTKRSAVRWGAAGDRYSRGSKFFKSLATDYTFPLADPNNNNNKKISSRTQKKKKKKRASTAVCSCRHFPHAASLQTNERTNEQWPTAIQIRLQVDSPLERFTGLSSHSRFNHPNVVQSQVVCYCSIALTNFDFFSPLLFSGGAQTSLILAATLQCAAVDVVVVVLAIFKTPPS